MTTENRDDSRRALVVHRVSGDAYVVEYCSLWDSDRPVGTRITTAVGPLNRRDDLGIEGPLEPSAGLFDRIDGAVNLSDDDADWLQAEEDAGRLTYPVGVR